MQRIIDLIKAKKAEGLTDTALGREIGVCQSSIQKMLVGETQHGLPTLKKLSKYFNLPLAYFTEEEGAQCESTPLVHPTRQEKYAYRVQWAKQIIPHFHRFDDVVDNGLFAVYLSGNEETIYGMEELLLSMGRTAKKTPPVNMSSTSGETPRPAVEGGGRGRKSDPSKTTKRLSA